MPFFDQNPFKKRKARCSRRRTWDDDRAEISLVLGAILFSIAIHYVMQRTPDVRSSVMPYIDILRKKMEYANAKIEKLEDCQADLSILRERIETLEERPQLGPLYEEMKNLQAEMKAAWEKIQEIIQMEDVAPTRDEV